MEFLHRNFSQFLLPSEDVEFSRPSSFWRDRLTQLVLALLRVNGTPLLDVSLDLAPANSSRYVGVIKVPQRAGLLPRLVRSRRGVNFFNKRVRRKQRGGGRKYRRY